MGLLSQKIKREELKVGDHIYSWRYAYVYAHHGIYIGAGLVIHFTQGAGREIGTGTFLDRIVISSSPARPSVDPCPRCGENSRDNGVILSCIDCFLDGGKLYLFEYYVPAAAFLAKPRGGTCTTAKSDPPEEVIHRATFLLENGFGDYNVFKNNCEDFSIYCKTGLLVTTVLSVGRSGQATSLFAAVSTAVSLPLRYLIAGYTGGTVFGYGLYCANRYASDIGVRRDAARVPVESLVRR
ncbi:LRAT domain-containing protein [Citrus sinensis]|uniref:LRAT domain-containing protein n=1 Tax=Citrus clementina TaxID=85681 RepID=V4T0D2_CITCL|nr:uncharacterized protein LOC18038728 [Citrus x clementina]XP_006481317.1 protein LEAD-SENSITIVE 1-like [Citrus sinensis]ESR42961.1 hypothetical protein CICLE_v10012617mg [Citrus x clementina]KAH9673651.1 LRAT domain-containing protein [Citrus sinensis]